MASYGDSAFFRFLIGGALYTAITYAIFLGLSLVLHYSLAYTLTYLVGICIAHAFAATFVFGSGFGLAPARAFRWYTWSSTSTASRRYLRHAPSARKDESVGKWRQFSSTI